MIFLADIISIIKRAALEAVQNQKPADIIFGVVESAAPLEISTEQKLRLKAAQLVIAENLTDRDVEAELLGTTLDGGDPAHVHGLEGRRTLRLMGGLKNGEKVILLRMSGGQKYIVLDRVVSA
ncbi:MAG: DUF2577 domain-containing protein [Clostridia bacterium]|nr:DUF2577 domain-containing protein [Clostridia bacterium]